MGWTRSWVLLAGVWVLLVGSECGTPISNSECEELYQGVAGFQLCDQTGSSCMFYRNNRPDPEISCEETCESAGAACLNAYNEGEPDVCSVGGELVCDESSCENACQVRENDSVCACGNASSGTGGTGGSGGFGGMEAVASAISVTLAGALPTATRTRPIWACSAAWTKPCAAPISVNASKIVPLTPPAAWSEWLRTRFVRTTASAGPGCSAAWPQALEATATSSWISPAHAVLAHSVTLVPLRLASRATRSGA
jgi:hypothetical protein